MHKLKYLQNCYGSLPKQGTSDWMKMRENRLGGSEIYKFINTKRMSTFKKNRLKRINNVCTWWGLSFEVIAKDVLNMKGYTIYDFGSLPSCTLPMAYSPDGFIVDNNELVLLEIKCPIYRHIKLETPIKPEYSAQVQAGMKITPADITWFCRFLFRKCSVNQIDILRAYDRKFHHECYKSKGRYPEMPDELAVGCLWWDTNNLIKEDIILRRPDELVWSTKPNISEHTKGTIMYFKLFRITKDIISPLPVFSDEEVWDAYQKFTT